MIARALLRSCFALATLLILVPLATLPARAAAPTRTLTVFAAASLDLPFREIAREFERAEPGVKVRLNLAGSQQLAAQLGQGASADVFAPADERWMAVVAARGELAGEAHRFARNSLTVIVPRSNPARIARLEDLSRSGIKLVLAADAVPLGRYTREMLARMAAEPGFPSNYARRVLANLVSEEESVRGVVNKVQLGEADAGVVYRSDVSPSLRRFVRELPVPEALNSIAHYPIAVLREAREPELAARFVAWVRSPRGQAVLARHALLPPEPASQ